MKGLSDFTDCAVISDDIDRRYFTGMKSSDGTLVCFRDCAYLIIDSRYFEKASKAVKGCEVLLQVDLYLQINKLIKKHEAKKVSVDISKTTVAKKLILEKKIEAALDCSQELEKLVRNIRSVKRQEEIECMIEAQRIAEKGFEHMLGFIKPGKTEREIQLELDFYMLSHGAEALSFDTIALSGANTSMPHGVPSDKPVEAGEFVLMDFGAVVEGYHSDMTRTICLGTPSDEMQKVYDIVLKAQLAGLAAVRSGMKASDLDGIARKIISDEGYGQCFGHSLGHGVGMDIHETPFASPKSAEVLKENMIVTVEPGIYLPGKFGVRIEDFVVVKNDGCLNMTNAPKQLISLM
ncbi:MAG: aminopeptidase P family protein [Ruminococcus sp.]|nr:aminopeptidase P family protein [Ruminococcus sp.]